MAIFSKSPTRRFEQTVAELKARVERLSAKRAAAQTELEAAQADRQQFALSGDLDDDGIATKLQRRVDSALSTLAGLDSALAAVAAQQAAAEGTLLAERQRIEREAAAAVLQEDIASIEERVGSWLAASRALANDLKPLGLIRFDAGQIGLFINDAAGQAETALGICLADLRAAAEAIAVGREPSRARRQ